LLLSSSLLVADDADDPLESLVVDCAAVAFVVVDVVVARWADARPANNPVAESAPASVHVVTSRIRRFPASRPGRGAGVVVMAASMDGRVQCKLGGR
jgi:hypothetical protein